MSSIPSRPAWYQIRTELLLPVLLVALQLVLLFRGAVDNGITSDETAHLTSGYSYWQFQDFRLQTENGNLPQRWAALPLLWLDPQFDTEQNATVWSRSNVWTLSHEFFFESGNPIYFLLLLARCMMMVWPIALSVLVYFWARHLWGHKGALLAMAMCVACPTLLANGPLVTSDTTAAFWLIAASGAWWKCLRETHGKRWLALSLAATGLAFVAKFSCVLLFPVYVLLVALHLATTRSQSTGFPWRALGRVAWITAGHALAIWATIWIFFGLRYSPVGAGMPELTRYFLDWDKLMADPGPLRHLIQLARETKILPEPYIEGFAHVRYQGAARSAFLLGEYRDTGWWWFFPMCFLLKSTMGELLMATAVFVGTVLCSLRSDLRPRLVAGPWMDTAPLWALSLVYIVFSLTSTLNIGQRHILPLYPILFILGGALMPACRRWTRRALIALPALSLAGALSVSPFFLTYFNHVAGGPTEGWRKLSDSSVDWGQGLPALADWLGAHHQANEEVYLSYFGSDDFSYHGIEAIPLAPIFENYRPRTVPVLKPGLYCIGATQLQDVYSPTRGGWDANKESNFRYLRRTAWLPVLAGEKENRVVDFGREGTEPLWMYDRHQFSRLCEYLKLRRPEAIVANCILVYRLSETEVNVVANGSPSELAALMEQAQRESAGS